MYSFLRKLFVSRVIGFVLVALLVYAGVTLAMRGVQRLSRSGTPALAHVDHPDPEPLEPIVRQHITVARERCEQIAAAGTATPRQRGRAFGELGKVYLAYSFAEAAIGCFQNAILLEPDEFRWFYYQAHAHMRLGQCEPAARNMAQAAKLMKVDATTGPQDFAAALCFLADMAVRLNKPDEARQTLDEVLRSYPNCYYALVKLAQMAAEANDGNQVLDLAQRALQVHPASLEARTLLATEYGRRGEPAMAAKFAVSPEAHRKLRPLTWVDPLAVAVDQLNQSATQHVRRGNRLAGEGRHLQAAQFFAQAVQANPKDAAARANFGATLAVLHRFEEAKTQLEEALCLNPKSQEARANLCLVYARLPATRDKARAMALTWRQEQPTQIFPLQTLAEVYLRLGEFDCVLTCCQDAVVLDPARNWSYLLRCRTLALLGRHREARAQIEEALKTLPGDPDLRHQLARLMVACPDSQVRDGTRGLAMMLELCAGQSTILRRETLALALAENQRYTDALREVTTAIADSAGDGTPHLQKRLRDIQTTLEKNKPWRETSPFSED